MTEPTAPTTPDPPRRFGVRRLLKFVGVSLYALSIRIALAGVTWILWAYFALNSAWVAGQVSELATQQIAGSISVAHIQWGPAPGYLRLIKPVVKAPDGTVVIAADWLDAHVAWWQLTSALAAGKDGIAVRVLKARMVGAKVRLDEDADGQLKLAAAFATGRPDDGKKGGGFALAIEDLNAREIGYEMDLGGTRISLAGGELQGRMELLTRPDSPMTLEWVTDRLSVARAEMKLKAFDDAGLAQLPAGPIVIQHLSGTLARVDVRGASIAMPDLNLENGDIVVQLAPKLDVRGERIRLAASTKAPFFGEMLGPLFDCKARIDGRFHFSHTGLFEASGKTDASGLIGGFVTDKMSSKVAVKLGHDRSGKADAETLSVVAENLDIDAFGGLMSSPRVTFRMLADGRMTTTGMITSRDVSIGKLLASPAVSIGGATAVALQGRLSGSIDSDVALRLLPGQDPSLDLVLKLQTNTTIARGKEGVLLRDAVPNLALVGGVLFEMGPQRGMKIALDKVAVTSQLPTLKKAPQIQAGSKPAAPRKQWIKAHGDIDVRGNQVALELDVNVPDLALMLAPLGVSGISGAIGLRNAHVDGTFAAPHIDAEFKGKGLVAAGWTVDEISARLGLRDGTLSLNGAKIAMLGARFAGDFEVDLFGNDFGTIHKLPRLRVAKLSVGALQLTNVFAPLGITGMAAIADLKNGKLAIDLRRPLPSLEFSGSVALRDVVVPQQKMSRVLAMVRVKEGVTTLTNLLVALPPVRHGQAAAEVTGSVVLDLSDPAKPRYDMDLIIPPMGFDQIGYVRELKMPLRGGMSGTVKAHGDTTDVAFQSELHITGLGWDKIWMGSAALTMNKRRGKPALLSSKQFFARFDLLAGSEIVFSKLIPTHMAFALRAHDLDPMDFLGLEPLPGAKVKANGQALLRLDFRPGKDVFSVDLELPPGGMDVELSGGLDPLRNKNTMRMKVLPTRVDIASTLITIGRHDLELCGAFLYPDEARKLDSRLRMYIAGTLDVPRYGALAESMASMDMRFSVQPTAALTGDTAAWCLRKPTDGAMRIAGPFDGLRMDGTIQLLPSTVVPRGFGKEVLLAAGGEVILHTDNRERMIITIPDGSPLQGRIEDGRFRTHGVVKLVKYLPDEIDMALQAEDYEYVAPKEYSVVMTPSLRFVGKNMLDAAKRDMVLSGNVEVTEAAYTKSHDRLRAIGQNVLGRATSSYSEPFLDRHPEYKEMRLRMVLNGRSIEVSSKLPGMRTDMELSAQKLHIGGTLGHILIDGRLEIAHGSTITYELVKKEFEIEKGYLDFGGDIGNPDLQIQARTDVELKTSDDQGSSLNIGPGLGGGGGGQLREVKVWVGVDGKLFDATTAAGGDRQLNKKLNVRLWSTPSYDQANLMSLILTGSLLTGAGGAVGIGYLTNELSEIFTKTLLSSFVKLDKFEVTPITDGGAQFEIRQRLGRSLSLSGNFSRGGSSESTEARFTFRINERLSMEGLASSSTQSNGINQSVYRASLRYKVPLLDFNEMFGL